MPLIANASRACAAAALLALAWQDMPALIVLKNFVLCWVDGSDDTSISLGTNMSNDHQAIYTEIIRKTVVSTFRRLGSPEGQTPAETLLIRNGYFCGRRFRASELEAVWFFEEEQLKIYGQDGSVAHVFEVASLLDTDEQRRAA